MNGKKYPRRVHEIACYGLGAQMGTKPVYDKAARVEPALSKPEDILTLDRN